MALAIVGAFLLTIALSDAPWLHERIHKAYGAQHECAATIFSSGSCEHMFAGATSVKPHQNPPALALDSQYRYSVIIPLGLALLEHAPPAFS